MDFGSMFQLKCMEDRK